MTDGTGDTQPRHKKGTPPKAGRSPALGGARLRACLHPASAPAFFRFPAQAQDRSDDRVLATLRVTIGTIGLMTARIVGLRDAPESFPVVWESAMTFLRPVAEAVQLGKPFPASWPPGGPWVPEP